MSDRLLIGSRSPVLTNFLTNEKVLRSTFTTFENVDEAAKYLVESSRNVNSPRLRIYIHHEDLAANVKPYPTGQPMTMVELFNSFRHIRMISVFHDDPTGADISAILCKIRSDIPKDFDHLSTIRSTICQHLLNDRQQDFNRHHSDGTPHIMGHIPEELIEIKNCMNRLLMEFINQVEKYLENHANKKSVEAD